jgi:hypothetical protein
MVAENDRWLVKEIIKSSAIPVKSRVIPTGYYQNFNLFLKKEAVID